MTVPDAPIYIIESSSASWNSKPITHLYNVHMEQTQETTSEAETHGVVTLRLVLQRSVVELQLAKGVSQILQQIAHKGEESRITKNCQAGADKELLINWVWHYH